MKLFENCRHMTALTMFSTSKYVFELNIEANPKSDPKLFLKLIGQGANYFAF